MTYCHVSAQIDQSLHQWDMAEAHQEAVEALANEICGDCESWDEAMELAEAQLHEERTKDAEDFLVSMEQRAGSGPS